MFPVVLVYAGLVTALVGLIGVVKPLRFAGLHQRRHSLWLLTVGVAMALVGWNLPAGTTQVKTTQSELDRLLPAYQFSEFHSISVNAPRERVYEAIKKVRADEIFLFRTLTWMRRFGRPGPESILNAPDSMSILEVATRTTFLTLAEKPGEELLVGTVVVRPQGTQLPQTAEQFRQLTQPGFVLAAMNFRLQDGGANTTLLSTETRVYATDDHARRRFAHYWRTIYPGSAFIRRMWLRAVKRRAEGREKGTVASLRGFVNVVDPCLLLRWKKSQRRTTRSSACLLQSSNSPVPQSEEASCAAPRYYSPSVWSFQLHLQHKFNTTQQPIR